MATYTEIRELFNSSDLLNRTTIAIIVYAENLMNGTPSTAQKVWIDKVFSSPTAEAKKVLMGVLAASRAATKEQIESATDAALQTEVDEIAPILIDALAGV